MSNTDTGTAIAPRNEGNIVHWSPWEELTEMRRRMDDLFSRSFGYTPLWRLIPNEVTRNEPDVDIYEMADKFQAHVALPGYTVKDIALEASENAITVTGERKAINGDEKATVHRKSGVTESGSFSLHYVFPSEIDPNKVKATFKNGILDLEIPKTERARAKNVKVKVGEG